MNARISATARVVAAGVLLQTDATETNATETGATEAARVPRACLAQDSRGRLLLRLTTTRAGRALLRALEALVLPRITAHYAWRKRRIAHWSDAALAAGARQVLILGAGWDGLGVALARHPSAPRVIEIDAAATHAVKRRALAGLGLDAGPLLVDGDLAADDLERTLRGVADFDPGAATLVVAEGVLMYLERERVVELAAAARRAVTGPLQVIATAMSSDVHYRPGFRRARPWVRWWLGAVGEPFRWGIERCALVPALATLGFGRVELASDRDHEDPDPSPGEWVFRAE